MSYIITTVTITSSELLSAFTAFYLRIYGAGLSVGGLNRLPFLVHQVGAFRLLVDTCQLLRTSMSPTRVGYFHLKILSTFITKLAYRVPLLRKKLPKEEPIKLH